TARSLAVLAGPNEVGFATHLYQSREYRRTSERAKSGKRIERCGISTFQIAQSLATVASFAIGNSASGLENDRAWSRFRIPTPTRGTRFPFFFRESSPTPAT